MRTDQINEKSKYIEGYNKQATDIHKYNIMFPDSPIPSEPHHVVLEQFEMLTSAKQIVILLFTIYCQFCL